MTISRRGFGFALGGAAVAAAGAHVLRPSAAFAQTAPAVRIACTANEPYAQAWFADELGMYQKAGLTAEVQLLGSGAAVATAMAGGAADIGIAATTTIAGAITHGLPFVMIAAGPMTTTKAPTALVCVLKTSAIRGAKDLAGKTIAVPSLKQTNDIGLQIWLQSNGVDLSSVHIIEAPFSSMGASLERGTYDAAVISEPALTNAIKHNNLRSIADPCSAISPAYTYSGWFTTAAYLKQNTALVKRVAGVLADAAKWANAHHNESADIVAKVTKIDVDTIRGEIRPYYAESIQAAEIQPQLDAATKLGILTRPVKASELFG